MDSPEGGVIKLEEYIDLNIEEGRIYWERRIGAVVIGPLKKNWTEVGQALPTLDMSKNKEVVVKICFDKDKLSRFAEAYARLKACNHKNIVTVFLSGIYNPPVSNPPVSMNGFIMEAGEQSLRDMLENQEDFPTDSKGNAKDHLTMAHCMSWMKQIAHALAYLHKKKIVHRDVKPRNILLFDNSSVCKLCDFDDCTNLRSRMTPEVGTGNFCAPEVAKPTKRGEERRKYNEKCDCYSFGVTVLATIFRCPDADEIPEAGVDPIETSVKCFISETKSRYVNLKSSAFDYESHKEKFSIIKKILDKALQADASQRQSSAVIYSLLKQPEAGAADTPPELVPKADAGNKSPSPKIPTIRSTSRKSNTVFYTATLPNNEVLTTDQTTQVLTILKAMGERVNSEVDNERPSATEHEFKILCNADSSAASKLIIEHNMGNADAPDSAKSVEQYFRENEQLIEEELKGDEELREIQFALWKPRNIEL